MQTCDDRSSMFVQCPCSATMRVISSEGPKIAQVTSLRCFRCGSTAELSLQVKDNHDVIDLTCDEPISPTPEKPVPFDETKIPANFWDNLGPLDNFNFDHIIPFY